MYILLLNFHQLFHLDLQGKELASVLGCHLASTLEFVVAQAKLNWLLISSSLKKKTYLLQ